MEDSPESEHLPLGWAEEYPDPEDPPVYSWISRPWSLDYSVHQAGSRKRSADSLDFSEQQNNCPSSSADQNSTGFRSLRFSSKLDVATGMKKRRMSNTAHSLTDPEFSKSEGMSPDTELMETEPRQGPRPGNSETFDRLPQHAISLSEPLSTDQDSMVDREDNARSNWSRTAVRPSKRGLRKPLEPSLEFKSLLSEATMAFIDKRYQQAEQLALRAIHINPEMFPAHSLLSEIHMARGERTKAVAALFNGAHTRPRDIKVWSKLAQWILDCAGNDRALAARDAIYCYSRILAVDKDCATIRHQRAILYYDSGHISRAATDFHWLLRNSPHNIAILRHLAEAYVDLGEIDRALTLYDHSLRHYRKDESELPISVSWSDINIYSELLGLKRENRQAVFQIRSLSRWLLGRRSENYWDSYDEDDREWDVDDQPRRVDVENYIPGQYAASTYGDGLPLELRVKLGVYRLRLGSQYLDESLKHFAFLEPGDCGPHAKLFDYPDLFREAAQALQDSGFLKEALQFFEPLRKVSGYLDISHLLQLASCYKKTGMDAQVLECYQAITSCGEESAYDQIQIEQMRKELKIPASTNGTVFESTPISRPSSGRPSKSVSSRQINEAASSSSSPFTMLSTSAPPQGRVSRDVARERGISEKDQKDMCSTLFVRLQCSRQQAREGDAAACSQWMMTALELIRDFQSEKAFFPLDRYVRFCGYPTEARKKTFPPKTEEITKTSGLLRSEQCTSSGQVEVNITVPNEFRSIPFHSWLDIFLEYAIMLAKSEDIQAAYRIISCALNANVFYHCPDFMFLIHVCWFSCALIANDNETLCNVARWFMKEYQFVTDGYRLFSALNRICDTENTWYNCGPSQKFILRQLKAMDFSLLGKDKYRSSFQERASFSTKDQNGNSIKATELDVGLLMLYGHILYVGKSYAYSINYFLRAFAIDPTNAMIHLSLALAYIHHAIKRQAENRHHLILQGLAFLYTYYDIRQGSSQASEIEEAEYNVGRAYHLLGMTSAAISHYVRCLGIRINIEHDSFVKTEGFKREAAFALQGLWAAGGNLYEAREVTERWLVI